LHTNLISAKEYPKYLRYRKNGRLFVGKIIKFNLPSKKLLNDYEIKKKEFTTGLNKEIMFKLMKNETKGIKPLKDLTEKQKRVAELLNKHSVEETAKLIKISSNAVYDHKRDIEKKGIKFKPVWANNHIIYYEIEGYEFKKPNRPTEAQF
jgi:hypothetical protein